MKLLINIIFCSALLWGGTCICYAQNSSNLPLKIDENFIIGRLDNGLTYYIRKNTNPARHAEFFIVHNVGSLQEEDDQRGLAHFLEHMAFNGTKNFPNKNLLNSLNEIGVKFGSNVNAYTSMDRTVYNISQVPISRESVIDSVLLMLHDWSYYITCDSLAIESERGVIREEWRRGDDARTRMMKAFFAIEQKGSRFAERSPIGVPEVINNFKPRALRDFYHKWYRPDLQAIIVVGDVDPIFVENKIKSIFSSIPKSTNPAPKGIYLIPANDSLEVEYYSDKELKATSVRILTRFPVVDSDSRLTNSFLKERLIMEMLSEGFRSRLSNQIKGGENPYKAAIPTQGDIYYASRIFRLTAVQNGNNYNEALKGVIKDYLTLIKCGFTQDEFENMKSSKRADIIKRKSRNSIPKSIDFVNAAVETFTRGDVLIDIAKKDDLLVSILNDLSVNDINEFISTTFINIYPTIVFAGNDTDSIYFTPKEKVRFLYDSLMNANLEPNISVSSNDIIIKDVLEKKEVKYKGVDNKNKNISQFELFNGNRLLFINNPNIKSGDVKFYLIKKGGYSNVEDKDIFDARIMKMFLPNIQIGNLDKNSFFNYSKRNQFRLSFLLENRYSLVSGTFDRNRIEPFFKSLYAFLAYPNVCPKDFNRFKDQVIRQLYKGCAT